jgi:putative two-component system response regulator
MPADTRPTLLIIDDSAESLAVPSDLLARSAPLHDIGKVSNPDTILLKTGPLDAAEWAAMKTHARLGSDAIEQVERDLDAPIEFLSLAEEIAHWHHEKWNGGGHPDVAGAVLEGFADVAAIAERYSDAG